MILLAVRRRQWLFWLTASAVIVLAGAVSVFSAKRYTAIVEVIVDPTVITRNPQQLIGRAEAWVRSSSAARLAAASLQASPVRSSDVQALTNQHRFWQLAVDQIPQSYALQIKVSAPSPRTAAALADAFAATLVTHLRETEPATAPMRIVSPADPNVPGDEAPIWVTFVVSVVAGLSLGTGVAIVAERRLDGVTSGTDVKSRLNLYHLGSVPLLRSVVPDATSALAAVIDAPFSAFAEAFRSIQVAVRQASVKNAKVFAITSALPAEGKSTTAACLARSLALSGEKVVVVDCDTRQSGASAALAGSQWGPGLVTLLQRGCELDDALVQDAESGAWILPSSQEGDLSPPLGGEAFAELLDILRTRFDWVLLDTAPVLALAATRSVLPLADAVVMIIRWRGTSVQAVKTALGIIPDGQAAWSGAVLTQVDYRKQARYGQGDASVYYQQSSSYYR